MSGHFVDVWHGSLACGAGRLDELKRFLSDGERDRARALSNERARAHFIAGRGLLRVTLADYLRCDPAALQFATGAHGKPFLVGHVLSFNLSHSGDYWVLAVADLDAIGVDVETIKPRNGMQAIARRCFSANEFEQWISFPPDEQRRAFFRLWTIKEAFVKAVGRGIALGLEHCEVDMADYRGLTDVPAEYGPASAWGVRELSIDASVHAALVTPSRDYVFRSLTF